MKAYSAEKREAVLATYQEKGKAAAVREHHIAPSTVTKWASDAGIRLGPEMKRRTEAACQTNEERRERMAVEFANVALLLLERVTKQNGIVAADVRSLLTAAAIAADKHVMLSAIGKKPDEPVLTQDDRQVVEDEIAAAIAEAERIARDSS